MTMFVDGIIMSDGTRVEVRTEDDCYSWRVTDNIGQMIGIGGGTESLEDTLTHLRSEYGLNI